MTDYYCDIGAETFSDATGADNSGNEYTGPAGLQAAIRGTGNATALAAGDTLYIKAGTGDLSRLVLIDCDGDDVSAWAPGNVVINENGLGDDWTGVVVQANDDPVGGLGADDLLLVWLDSGKTEDDIDLADGVRNSTLAQDVVFLAAKSTPGITLSAQGAGGSPINFVGVDSSWAEDGTLSILDGVLKAYAGFNNSAILGHFGFRNIHVKRTTAAAWAPDNNLRYSVLTNCIASGGSGQGFGKSNGILQWSSLLNCKAYDNTGGSGFNLGSSRAANCVAYNNSAHGFNLLWGSEVVHSVAFENATGFYLQHGTGLVNCVSDKNTYGVHPTVGGHTAVGCRITNNTTYGVRGSVVLRDPYCFYSGNGANFENDIHDDTIRGVSTRVTSGVVGYIDADNADLSLRNYGLTNQAAARRQEATL